MSHKSQAAKYPSDSVSPPARQNKSPPNQSPGSHSRGQTLRAPHPTPQQSPSPCPPPGHPDRDRECKSSATSKFLSAQICVYLRNLRLLFLHTRTTAFAQVNPAPNATKI